jgi:hypothetical protein
MQLFVHQKVNVLPNMTDFAFRNAIHEAARAAGLTATIKPHVDETSTRPGDIFIQKWIWGKDVALDIIVVSQKVSP